MDASTSLSERWEVVGACHLIRGRWSREERRQRQRLAEAKQQELRRLLEATSGFRREGVGNPIGGTANGKRPS